ncbi:hypothetical protein D3C76_1411580 [compost metagenome]
MCVYICPQLPDYLIRRRLQPVGFSEFSKDGDYKKNSIHSDQLIDSRKLGFVKSEQLIGRQLNRGIDNFVITTGDMHLSIDELSFTVRLCYSFVYKVETSPCLKNTNFLAFSFTGLKAIAAFV